MAYGQIDYKNQPWVEELGKYLDVVSDEYSAIGRNCRVRVSNPMLTAELTKRMDERDGNMLVSVFDRTVVLRRKPKCFSLRDSRSIRELVRRLT